MVVRKEKGRESGWKGAQVHARLAPPLGETTINPLYYKLDYVLLPLIKIKNKIQQIVSMKKILKHVKIITHDMLFISHADIY